MEEKEEQGEELRREDLKISLFLDTSSEWRKCADGQNENTEAESLWWRGPSC